MKIKELKQQAEFKKASSFMAAINQDFNEEFYLENLSKIEDKNYKLALVFTEGEKIEKSLGLISVRASDKLKHGRILEIEDFEINSEEKGQVAKLMIEWALKQAPDFNCKSVICGLLTTKLEAHKIFSMEKFILEGFLFKKEIFN